MRLPSRFPDPNEPIDNRNSEGHVQIPKNNIPVAGGPLTRGRSACGQQSDSYAHKVNTLIGTRGVGLTSGYLYPGATYPFGMVQFTPTYCAKRGGIVINS